MSRPTGSAPAGARPWCRRRGVRRRAGQGAGGVAGPGVGADLTGGVFPGRVDRHGPQAVGVGAADGDLDADASLFGHDERGLDDEFVQHAAADLVTGPYGEFDQTGARHEDDSPTA